MTLYDVNIVNISPALIEFRDYVYLGTYSGCTDEVDLGLILILFIHFLSLYQSVFTCYYYIFFFIYKYMDT